MRAPLSLAAALLFAAAAASAQTVTIEARVRAPRGVLIDSKIDQTGRLACELMRGCAKPVYTPDDQTGFTGKVVVAGAGWRAQLSQARRQELLARLDALWGEPVSVREAAAAPKGGAPAPRPRPGDRLGKALPSLLPSGLADGSAAGLFYDRARSGGAAPAVSAAPASSPARARLSRQPLAAPRPAAPQPPPLIERAERRTPYSREIGLAARKAGVDPDVLSAVVAAKSGFRAGVEGGLCGLAPLTFRKLGPKGADLRDPQANLDVGARVLGALLRQFDGDVHRALAAYQVGPRAVLRSGGIPNDRSVREFLAAYEREFRRGPVKPPVEPAAPPTAARRLKDTVQLALTPKDTASVDPRASGAAHWWPLIKRMAARHAGLDPALMEAMIMPESGGDPNARSGKGAVGLGQLMPKTARELGVKNPRDPAQNLRGMSDHLHYLIAKYDDPVLAVAAYNAGEGRVDKAGEKVPYLRETRAYVVRVFENYFHLTGKKVDVQPDMAPRPPKRRARKRSRRRSR